MTDAARFETLDTPCVLIDRARVEANLKRAQAYADAHDLKLRPHIKTHKLPRFAHLLVELARSASPVRSSAKPR
jgi:D-serine deaminase-like pyridoxal phosphate-dependent protein